MSIGSPWVAALNIRIPAKVRLQSVASARPELYPVRHGAVFNQRWADHRPASGLQIGYQRRKIPTSLDMQRCTCVTMAMHWYPDRRNRIERLLLDHYHAELLRQGVSGYDRQTLDEDYRLSVLWLITRPSGRRCSASVPGFGGTISSASCWRLTTSTAAICLPDASQT
jgi:hypothetical protein